MILFELTFMRVTQCPVRILLWPMEISGSVAICFKDPTIPVVVPLLLLAIQSLCELSGLFSMSLHLHCDILILLSSKSSFIESFILSFHILYFSMNFRIDVSIF